MKLLLGALRVTVYYCWMFIGKSHEWQVWILLGALSVVVESVRDVLIQGEFSDDRMA